MLPLTELVERYGCWCCFYAFPWQPLHPERRLFAGCSNPVIALLNINYSSSRAAVPCRGRSRFGRFPRNDLPMRRSSAELSVPRDAAAAAVAVAASSDDDTRISVCWSVSTIVRCWWRSDDLSNDASTADDHTSGLTSSSSSLHEQKPTNLRSSAGYLSLVRAAAAEP